MIEVYQKYLNLKKSTQSEWKGLCPFHEEKTPSFQANELTGLWYCFGCGQGGTLNDFLDKLGKPEEKESVIEFAFQKSRDDLNFNEAISPIVIEQLHKNLKSDYSKLQYLIRDRCISYITICKFLIGWDTHSQRYSIPIKTKSGRFINIKLHNSSSNPKSLYWRKGGTRLYPIIALQKNTVVICEGEFDCLVLHSLGINAITSTSGAGSWQDSWSTNFVGKQVKLIYDSDDAGQVGAMDVLQKLKTITKSIKAYKFPISEQKVDITDFVRNKGNVFRLLEIEKRG